MSDSLRPKSLVCPRCKNELELDVPQTSSITYTCKCGALVEESLVTGITNARSIQPPPSTD